MPSEKQSKAYNKQFAVLLCTAFFLILNLGQSCVKNKRKNTDSEGRSSSEYSPVFGFARRCELYVRSEDMRLKRKIVDLAFILAVSITLIGCQSKIDRLEADGYISSLDKKARLITWIRIILNTLSTQTR